MTDQVRNSMKSAHMLLAQLESGQLPAGETFESVHEHIDTHLRELYDMPDTIGRGWLCIELENARSRFLQPSLF